MIFVIHADLNTYLPFKSYPFSNIAFIYDAYEKKSITISKIDNLHFERDKALVICESKEDSANYQDYNEHVRDIVHLDHETISEIPGRYIVVPYNKDIDDKSLLQEALTLMQELSCRKNDYLSLDSFDFYKNMQEGIACAMHQTLYDQRNIPAVLVEYIKSFLVFDSNAGANAGHKSRSGEELSKLKARESIDLFQQSASLVTFSELVEEESNVVEEESKADEYERILAKDPGAASVPYAHLQILNLTSKALSHLTKIIQDDTSEADSLRQAFDLIKNNLRLFYIEDKTFSILLSEYNKTTSYTNPGFIKNLISSLDDISQELCEPYILAQLINNNIFSGTIAGNENLLSLFNIIDNILPLPEGHSTKINIQSSISNLDYKIKTQQMNLALSEKGCCNESFLNFDPENDASGSGGANPDCVPLGGHAFIEVAE